MTPLSSLKRISGITKVRPRSKHPVQIILQRTALFIAVTISLIVVLGATSEQFTNLLMVPVTEDQSLRRSDVIIVLGAGSRTTTPHLPPQADARVATGVELLKDGWAPKIIVSGGYNKHTDLTEAPLMAEIAYSKGANQPQVILEPTSKNTWENATNSLAIAKANGWKTALVVTSPYHTWRACMIFKKQMADVHCIAAPLRTERSHTAYERLMDTRSVLREYGAIVYFFLKHYI